jgi:hypothetical protein
VTAQTQITSEVEKGREKAREETYTPLTPDPRAATATATRPTASVTISHKIGWSSLDYHEKADVMVEVTLPCMVDDIDATVGRIRRILDEKLPEELDRVVNHYFEGGPLVFGAGRKVTK